MGSFFHRVAICMTVAIQAETPCLINDAKWLYDRGNLSRYFNGTKICSTAEKRNRRLRFISVEVTSNYRKFVLRVPSKVKSALEFCHEDPAAWYMGVILKNMFNFSEFSTKFMATLMNESRIPSNVSISDITSLHIRSTDKFKEATIFTPPHYFKVLKYTCLVFGHLCASNVSWVATDNNANLRSFASETKKDIRMKNFAIFGLNVDSNASRYSTHSLMQFLTDLQVLSTAK